MSKPKWKFIVNFWNLLDLTIIVLLIYEIMLVLDHVGMTPVLDDLRLVENVYRETYWLAAPEKLQRLVAGIIVLASWIKVHSTILCSRTVA